MKIILRILILLLIFWVGPALADDVNVDTFVPIIGTDPSLSDPLPAISTIEGVDGGFKSSEGAFYNLHGGAQDASTASLGTSVGYNFKYIGVELDYDAGSLLRPGDVSNSTGAKIFLQYPFGRFTPYLSIGMNLRFMAIGSWTSSVFQRSFGVGATYELSPTTELNASAAVTSTGNGEIFKHGAYTMQYKVGITIHF